MDDFDRWLATGEMLRKEAARPITGAEAVGHLFNVARSVPGIVTSGFRTMGKETTKALALNKGAPGAVARTAGKAVQYTPHAAAAYGAYKLTEPTVVPYMRSKMDQFRMQQAATAPYYDPMTMRYY